jgi:hypothetical protein
VGDIEHPAYLICASLLEAKSDILANSEVREKDEVLRKIAKTPCLRWKKGNISFIQNN